MNDKSIILKNYLVITFILFLILLIAGWHQVQDDKLRNNKWEKINEFFIKDIIEYKGEVIFCAKEGIFNLSEKLNSEPAYCLATNDEILLAGTNDGILIFDSTWKKIKLFQNGRPAQVRVIKSYKDFFFLGHTQGSYGVTTWHPVKGKIYEDDFNAYVRSIEVNNSIVYAGDEDGNIWLSDNLGESFDSTIYLDNFNLAVRSIKWIDDDVYIGAGWIFKNFEKTDYYITPMDFYMNYVLSGDQGIFIFDDELTQLIPFNEGLNDLRVSKLILDGSSLYVGTATGLYKRPLH
jgi:hypothetical protein